MAGYAPTAARSIRPLCIACILTVLAICSIVLPGREHIDTRRRLTPSGGSAAAKLLGAATEYTLLPEWVSPKPSCFVHPNDWSKCAGDHMLYPPASKEALLARDNMCLHEPLCWKQLDWKDTLPPIKPCKSQPAKDLRFYDMSYHDFTMGAAATAIEKSLNADTGKHHEVFLCNCKKARATISNYKYQYKLCPTNKGLECSWKTPYSDARAAANYENYHNDAHFMGTDALIFGFGSAMWEHWMAVNKTLVLNLDHRVNQHRCTEQASKAIFNKLRYLASAGDERHVIGAQNIYDVEYVRHYTGIHPVYLPPTLYDALAGLTWKQTRAEFTWIGNMEFPIPAPLVNSKKYKFLKPNHAGHYDLKDLTGYAGAVLFPYSISAGKVMEQYGMNIPIFAPSVELAKTMVNDRTATYMPYCPGLRDGDLHAHPSSPYAYSPNVRMDSNGPGVADDVKFWIGFAEIYLLPCVTYFNTWEELEELIDSTDRVVVSRCMQRANLWRHFEEIQNWCWAASYVGSKGAAAPPQ